MTKKCAFVSCGKALPPSVDRTLIDIHTVPGFTWQFWKFFWGLMASDINQAAFCTPAHMMEYLKTFQMPVKE